MTRQPGEATRTVAWLPVSAEAFDEIAEKLKTAEYGHLFMPNGDIDMDGIALRRLGPTGDFPEGKSGDDDKGALMMAVSREGDNVRVDFGTAVKWLGLSPKAAAEFAVLLLKNATNGASIQILVGRAPVSAAERDDGQKAEDKKDDG